MAMQISIQFSGFTSVIQKGDARGQDDPVVFDFSQLKTDSGAAGLLAKSPNNEQHPGAHVSYSGKVFFTQSKRKKQPISQQVSKPT